MFNNSIRLVLLTPIALLLTACGGSSSTNTSTTIETPDSSVQPIAISANNWSSARLIQTTNPSQKNVEIVGSELIINIQSKDISQGSHLQIYINSDNKPETGFQFDNEAWEESGVDYLIEDGDLFKSTANNSGWNWNVNIGAIDYTIDTDTASAKIDLSLLGDICNTLKIGIMTRDEFWNISTFSPVSSQMQTFRVSYCNTEIRDTVKPKMVLLGANPLKLSINDTFIDPGATASDNIDGDISDRIKLKSTINTAIAGTYKLTYVVTDIAGNSANISRTVIVSDVARPEGIVIDGNSNDWSNITSFSSSADAIMKVTDDEEKLYILVTSSNLGDNIQVLMDTDNKSSTGLDLASQISTWLAGADYMIENNSLDKSKSNTLWAWDYGITPIEYIQTSDTLEIAIKKSDFNILANKIPMGFVSRSENWNVNYILPTQSLPIYKMQFAKQLNPVTANNDSVTTPNNKAITIDVQVNDNTTNTGLITSKIVTLPSSGNAVITQNKIKYTPSSDFTGTVNFSYEVTDSSDASDTANVKVIVTAPVNTNTAPVAKNDSKTTAFNTAITVPVLNNDKDTDGDTLSITSISIPDNGGKAVKTNKTIRYTPIAGFSGTETFTYSVSDGKGGTDSAKVTITVTAPSVNRFPDAVEDAADVLFNQTVTVDVLSNDTDPDNDVLSVLSIVQPPVGIAKLNTNGTIFFDPQNNVGSISIGYTVSDGRGGTDFAILTVSSTDPSSGNFGWPNITDENITIPVNTVIFIDVLDNDSDPDGDTLILDELSGFDHGTAIKMDGGIQYTPDPSFIGTDYIYYGVHDGFGHNGFGTVTIKVTQ